MDDPQRAGKRLLAWYDGHHRHLPWRVSPAASAAGATADPYCVWLSEVMLQQTRVETVKPYFERFLERWPSLADLAAAPLEDVLAAWAGLGYYSRARNLKLCAETVMHCHGGQFPASFAALRSLPGIGDYTAAAIAAIAFGAREVVIDGNVERVACRLDAIALAKPALRRPVREVVAAMLPADRPGDFAQAMMDLGATLCTPRGPDCPACPLREDCAAHGSGDPERYPLRAGRPARPVRLGAAFVAVDRQGAVLLRRRSKAGLLGGMVEVPTTGWHSEGDGETSCAAAPFPAAWQATGKVRHIFTHFTLELAVYRADDLAVAPPEGHWWTARDHLGNEALPTLFRKVIRQAFA